MHPLKALSFDLFDDARPVSLYRILLILFVRRGNSQALVLIRLAQLFHARGHRLLAHWATRRLRRNFGCFVPASVPIGPGLRLPHPNGIVIGSGARIGANCTIYHQVTLGGARRGDWQANRYPILGDRVLIFAGAKLIGAIQVGDDALIGANALVNRDVPERHRAIGIPARMAPLPGIAQPGSQQGSESFNEPSS